jgi:hypothetical protein
MISALIPLALNVLLILHPGAPPAPDPEAEYYRGVYDTCLQGLRQVKPCLNVVRRAKEADWYGKPSSGWRWPVEGVGEVG